MQLATPPHPSITSRHSAASRRAGFTLVEILIVVVILGILASMVVPQFARATEQAKSDTTYSELQKIRRHIEIFKARNAGAMPAVVDNSIGDWGEIVGNRSQYLQGAPVNGHVGGDNAKKIRYGTGPDTTFHTDYGWIVDMASGQVWAGSFDADDKPLSP
jgi:prepilin-type N-terminal cleavage/methylation domain-containing protein